MNGNDLKVWRTSKGWTQSDLMRELDIKSRQTIVKWEASDKIPRLLYLAILAIDGLPDARLSGIVGVRVADSDASRQREVALRISRESDTVNSPVRDLETEFKPLQK